MNEEKIIDATRRWLKEIVIDCHFCPFAAREYAKKTIHYTVLANGDGKSVLEQLSREMERLDDNRAIETTLLILPGAFEDFNDYLDLLSLAEQFLEREGYEGIYQIASFHPDYLFAGSYAKDPANYTNRSPFPILHLLREDSVTRVLESYANPENIPDRNIEFANKKGIEYFRSILASILSEA